VILLPPLGILPTGARRGSFLLLWAALLPTVPHSLAAQHVRGTVVAAETGLPIGQARVTIAMEDESAPDVVGLSRSDGTFQLAARRSGEVRVHVEQFGYWSWSSEVIGIEGRGDVVVEVRLERRPFELDELEVTTTSRGDEFGRTQFERRRSENEDSRATFLDPIHIALANPRNPAELFRGVPGIILEHDDQMIPQIGRCILYYLDHIRLPVMAVRTSPRHLAFGGADRLSQIVSQREIRGIEVYPSIAAVPSELRDTYRGGDVLASRCALVQIWTTIGW
jgi:hypothetical protein